MRRDPEYGFEWTDENIELLKKLWLEEGLSASQVAAVLGKGCTRNAVVGKVHRLKLSGRAKPQAASYRNRSNVPRQRRASAPRVPSAPKTKVLPKPPEPEEDFELPVFRQELFIPVDQRVSLDGLNESTCKWPIGDPLTPDFYFCGQHPQQGKPYCEFHSRRAYHQVEKKSRGSHVYAR